MKQVKSADGTKLHCEENGAGTPVLFVHEYGGSCRSFDGQVAAFIENARELACGLSAGGGLGRSGAHSCFRAFSVNALGKKTANLL